jgi:long-chain acyl-CoA synthetase
VSSGENIEPQPIEDAVCVSPFIKFCTVVGNDCKHLGALVVPDQDAIVEHFAGARDELKVFCHSVEA